MRRRHVYRDGRGHGSPKSRARREVEEWGRALTQPGSAVDSATAEREIIFWKKRGGEPARPSRRRRRGKK